MAVPGSGKSGGGGVFGNARATEGDLGGRLIKVLVKIGHQEMVTFSKNKGRPARVSGKDKTLDSPRTGMVCSIPRQKIVEEGRGKASKQEFRGASRKVLGGKQHSGYKRPLYAWEVEDDRKKRIKAWEGRLRIKPQSCGQRGRR